MIYIITATYSEAHPFINRLQLKKDTSHTRFQVFLNQETNLCLIISGTGSVPAAVAVSSICTEYGAEREDFLLNVGICAQIRNINENENVKRAFVPGMPWDTSVHETENTCQTGQIFLCSKIKEHVTGKTFYPDILYRHKFREAQIITGARLYEKSLPSEAGDASFCLYDMEAAAIYQAGAFYFGPHQMSFLKVISDDGNFKNVTPAQVELLISRNMESIADYITTLQTVTTIEHRAEAFDERYQKRTGQTAVERLCLDLHCSRTMSESVRQHIRYCMLSGIDYISVLEEMYREGKLPCKDKREGKQCFDELKERLL